MYPVQQPGSELYGPGDIEGLWWVGAAHPCRPAGKAAEHPDREPLFVTVWDS